MLSVLEILSQSRKKKGASEFCLNVTHNHKNSDWNWNQLNSFKMYDN